MVLYSLPVVQALQRLADALDQHLALLESRQQHACAPRLNTEDSEQRWLQAPGAPYPALPDENPPGRTLPYQEAMHAWD